MSTFEAVTFAVALVGAILGVINTYVGLSKERVKLVVTPKQAIPVGGAPDNIGCSIDVVNLSAFPITVAEVGFFYRGTKKRSVIVTPVTADGGPFPRRLEPRSAVSLYCEKPRAIVGGRRLKCAYVTTDCGVVCKGTSPALEGLANAT